MRVTEMSADKLAAFRDFLKPGSLRSAAPREVVLQAMKFGRLEAEFAERFYADTKPTRISVIASETSQHLIAILKIFLFSEGLRPVFASSEYDAISTSAFDSQSSAWSDLGDEVIILPAMRDIKLWPALFATEADLESWAEAAARPILATWEKSMRANPRCRIYQGTFVEPILRQLGNLELRHSFSRTRCIQRLNQKLFDRAPQNVCMVDMEYLASLCGKAEWTDEAAFYSTKQPFAIRVMPLVASYLSRLVSARLGNMKKCLVLDLDNTIWGGVVGDDGIDALRLSPSDPVGEAFLGFQEYVLSLKRRGVILAACSKNDESIAREVFRNHPDILLKEDDFSVFVANWDDKHKNLEFIARQLNIGQDSLVFYDDNPAERALVARFAPDVFVVDVPADPAAFSRALELSFAFEWPHLTEEDLGRAQTYASHQNGAPNSSDPQDYADYLRSLNMSASIAILEQGGTSRFHQLISKTNQFNLRTIRYSEAEIHQLLHNKNYIMLDVKLNDIHTNYGSIANVVIRILDDCVFIENWVMSCRTFKRGIEDAVFNVLRTLALDLERHFIVGEFCPTAKNAYVADLLPRFGMTPWESDEFQAKYGQGGQLYRAPVDVLGPRDHQILLSKQPVLSNGIA